MTDLNWIGKFPPNSTETPFKTFPTHTHSHILLARASSWHGSKLPDRRRSTRVRRKCTEIEIPFCKKRVCVYLSRYDVVPGLGTFSNQTLTSSPQLRSDIKRFLISNLSTQVLLGISEEQGFSCPFGDGLCIGGFTSVTCFMSVDFADFL